MKKHKMIGLGLMIGWLCIAFAGIPVQATPGRYYLRVTADDFKAALREFGQVRQYDIAGVDIRKGIIDIIVPEPEFRRLESEKKYHVEILAGPEDKDILQPDPQYKEPAEIDAILHQFQADYPDITYLISIGLSEEGRDIWAIKISDNASVDEDEPVVLFNGQHHAREVMASEVPLDTIEYLCSNYGTDPDVTRWVNDLEIWVVPMVNVDGVNYVFTVDYMWRKDRHHYSGYSDYGIDPNRNYPTFWGSCNGSSGDPGSDTYRGEAPRDAYCVDNMIDFASDIRPVFDISYHSYSELVIYPYGCDGAITPEDTLMADIAQNMAQRIQRDDGGMGYDYGLAWTLLYAVDGSDIDWYYADLGTFAYVIELNSYYQGFQPGYNQWRDDTVERVRPAWQYLLDRVYGPAITGRVLDACTGSPVPGAEVTIEEQPLGSDESPRLTDSFGRFFRLVNPGTFHLHASAPEYRSGSAMATVSSSRILQDIFVTPDDAFGLGVTDVVIHDSGDADGVLDPGETAWLEVTVVSINDTTNVEGDLACTDPYVNISDAHTSFGNIPDGASSSSQAPHFGITVDPGCPDDYQVILTLHFSADQTLCADTVQIPLLITTYKCPVYDEPLNENPGYTIDNTGSGGWEFGVPSSGPGSACTGTTCYATNLSGDYGNYGDFKLTSTAFDCSDLSDTTLYFQRWLHNEGNYDTAYVQVSSDGNNWTNVWSGYAYDSVWTEQRFDISAVADGQPEVYVRWRLISDSYIVEAGFYVDDIRICGKVQPPAPDPTWTPQPFTPTPTAVPTMTPTPPPGAPTYTPPPTSPAPTFTHVPGTATPTPDNTFVCGLELNQSIYTKGDWFQLDVWFYNGTDERLDLQEYLVLDVYGMYFFYPQWKQNVDYRQRAIEAGRGETETVLAFYWPDTSGENADDIRFYLGFLDPSDMTVAGDIAMVSFGYR